MKNIKYILFALGVLGITSRVKAQQDPMYTHYMYNTLSVNPGYAGSRDAMSFMGLARFQWVGLDGAPMTQTFQVHSPVFGGLAAGLSVQNDKIGPTTRTDLCVDLAYHFKLSPKSRLSIGMKGTVDFFNNNLATLTLDQQADPDFASNYASVLPNIGAGIYYYHTNFYAGFSIPQIAQHRINTGLAETKRHYFIIAGGYIPVTKKFDIKPTALVKIVEGAPVQGDFTLEFVFNKKFTAGAHVRSFDGIGALLGFDIMPNFRVGYSFDWPLTELSRVGQGGSHEIMLRYDLKWGQMGKIKSPRYF
jgi:type IX secretion system PorP/SprF family membrane protein